MSFLKKLFPFLFKSEKSVTAKSSANQGSPSAKTVGASNGVTGAMTSTNGYDNGLPIVIVAYGIVARVRNARGLRKNSKVYVRAVMEDGDRVRVRGTAPNGKKITIAVPRRTLMDYASEGVPEHVAKHYDRHSLFKDEHEAKVKAEALGKH